MDDLKEAVDCLKSLARKGDLCVPETQAIWLVLSELRKHDPEFTGTPERIDERFFADPTAL